MSNEAEGEIEAPERKVSLVFSIFRTPEPGTIMTDPEENGGDGGKGNGNEEKKEVKKEEGKKEKPKDLKDKPLSERFDYFLDCLNEILSVSFFILIGLAALIFYEGVQEQEKLAKMSALSNYVYDPDDGANMSRICLAAKDAYKTKYEDGPCLNKTFIEWYNPWVYHNSWKKFWKKKEEKRQGVEKGKDVEEEMTRTTTTNKTQKAWKINEVRMKAKEMPRTKENTKIKKAAGGGRVPVKSGAKSSELFYAILVSLLLMSTLAACWEVAKERMKRHSEEEEERAKENECTLADFTINRHLRRESQQQNSSSVPKQGSLEIKSKVTQTLIHQSSLDRAFPIKSSEDGALNGERRNSVPGSLLGGSSGSGTRTGSPLYKRIQRLSSIDVTPEDMNLDVRRKSRHFIRRH